MKVPKYFSETILPFFRIMNAFDFFDCRKVYRSFREASVKPMDEGILVSQADPLVGGKYMVSVTGGGGVGSLLVFLQEIRTRMNNAERRRSRIF